jgi:iron complex outermembrane receptor protein
MKKVNMLAGVSLAVLALAPPLAARAATAAATASADPNGQIADVIVTATKTGATNLQKTPISVSVVGADTLSKNEVVSLKDLPSEVSSLKLINAGVNPIVYIRGVGGYASNNEQDVGIYQDGVYLGRTSAALDSNFNDIERVEVLEGPQGTTFGRNSVGGAVNFISQQPSQTFTAKETLSVGNYNLVDEAFNMSGPVTENVQSAIAVGYYKHDGYVEDVVEGVPPVGAANRVNVRFQTKWEINNDMTNLVRADYLYTNENFGISSTLLLSTEDPRFITCPANTAASCHFNGYASPLADAAIGNYKYYGAGAAQQTAELDYGINDEYNWKINDNLSLKNLVAYRTDENRAYYSGNGTEYLTGATSTLYAQHQFSDEMDLVHSYGNFKGVLGLYGWTEYEHQIGISIKTTAPPAFTGSESESYQDTRFPTQSYAVFLNETYQITPDIGLIFGGRYTQEHKVLDTYNTSYLYQGGLPAGWAGSTAGNYGSVKTLNGQPVMAANSIKYNTDGSVNAAASTIFPFVLGYGGYSGVGSVQPDLVQNVNAFTPKVGLQWQATQNAFLYVDATRGFKSGGFNFTARNTFGATYLPEWITTYEVGAKTDWLDKRLRVDVAVFRNDWSNLQVTEAVNLPDYSIPIQIASNAAAARETGLEANVTFKPWDEWTFTSSVTWLPDAVYTNYTTGQVSGYIEQLLIQRGDPRENANANTYNASGNRLNNAPDVSANITGQKDFDLGNGNTAFIRGEAQYTGNTYFDISDDPISRRNPYALYNASIGWASSGGHYQVSFWARNLADTQYATTVSIGSLPAVTPGAPRTFGLQLQYTY